MKLAIIILAAVAAFAQTKDVGIGRSSGVAVVDDGKSAVTPKPVDPTAAAVFWKARHDMLAARLAVIENNAKASEALSKITCEAGYQLAESQSPLGLACVPKPKEPKK